MFEFNNFSITKKILIIIILPLIIFFGSIYVNIHMMINMNTDYFIQRCILITLLLLYFCIIAPIMFLKKFQYIIIGIFIFTGGVYYYTYLPIQNFKKFAKNKIIHQLQFDSDNYYHIIGEEILLFNACQNDCCILDTLYVKIFPTSGNKFRMKIITKDLVTVISNELNFSDIIINNKIMKYGL